MVCTVCLYSQEIEEDLSLVMQQFCRSININLFMLKAEVETMVPTDKDISHDEQTFYFDRTIKP